MSDYEPITAFNTNAPIMLHIVVVAIVVITGSFCNGAILYIQHKKPNRNEMDIYTIALASVDLFVCLVLGPQYPFLGAYIKQYNKGNIFALRQLFTCAEFAFLMTLGVLTAIALIRVNAVFRPFTFVWSPRRSKYIVLAIGLICLIYSCLSNNTRNLVLNGEVIASSLTAIQILLCLVSIAVSYLAIVIKLYRHGRHLNKYSADKTKNINQGKNSSKTSEPNKQGRKTSNPPESSHKQTYVSTIAGNDDFKDIATTSDSASGIATTSKSDMQIYTTSNSATKIASISNSAMEIHALYRQTNGKGIPRAREKSPTHLKTLKMFFVVTVIFLISYIPLILISVRVTNMFYIVYIAFLAYNSNFVVYIVFNTDFRKDAIDILKRIKSYFEK